MNKVFKADAPENHELLKSVLETLTRPQKALDSKWFYDQTGSELFEQITTLPEYYPTKTEAAILTANTDVWSANVPEGATLLELGSGASVKTQILLNTLTQINTYVPVDISEQFLHENAGRLAQQYEHLNIVPVVADFMTPFGVPVGATNGPLVGFFPGSTLGNLDPIQAVELLKMARGLPNTHGFILGIDLVKDRQRLIDAYDDAQGVTAAFNLNLLTRLNCELGADFDLSAFAHEARWNEDLARIEMHLVSTRAQTVTIGGTVFDFTKGESIHTENSHKYTKESITRIVGEAGWTLSEFVTDARNDFAVCILSA